MSASVTAHMYCGLRSYAFLCVCQELTRHPTRQTTTSMLLRRLQLGQPADAALMPGQGGLGELVDPSRAYAPLCPALSFF